MSLTVGYREPANVFEILDNVSSWLEGKCDEEYRSYWQERFGLTADDERRFATYKEIRKRYYPRPLETDPALVLFGRARAPDRMAEAFYGAADLRTAFAELARFMTPEEVTATRAFYEAYAARLAPLLAESKAYVDVATTVQRRLDGAHASTFVDELAAYYRVTNLPRFDALYVWWPPVANTTANNRGRFLLLKYNPTEHRTDAERAVGIAIHELAHYVSEHQSDEQKKALTKTFLAGCDPTGDTKPVKILEEPLAVAHQKLFESVEDPKHFDLSAKWYGGDPWIGPFAKMIYPQVKQAHEGKRTIDDELMKTMAKSCVELRALKASGAAPAGSASAPPPPPAPAR